MYPFVQVELDRLNVGAGNVDLYTETRKTTVWEVILALC